MKKLWSIAALLWGIADGFAQENAAIQQQVMASLQKRFQQTGEVFSQPLLDELVGESGLEEVKLRRRLLVLLDTLETQRRRETEVWKELLVMGGDEVGGKKVGKYIRELGKSARKGLEKEGNYPLVSMMGQAAKKAKLQAYQGRDLLALMLRAGSGADEAERLPEKIGLLVDGRSHYEHAPMFFSFWVRANVSLDSLEKLDPREWGRNFHDLLEVALVRELSDSPGVKWVVHVQNPRLQPDYRLAFEIDEMNQDYGSPGAGGGAPKSAYEDPHPVGRAGE